MYPSDIIRMTKPSIMIQAGLVARMGGCEMRTQFWSDSLAEGERVMFRWILGKWCWNVRIGFIWLRIGTVTILRTQQ
jgi:hypothetical protein